MKLASPPIVALLTLLLVVSVLVAVAATNGTAARLQQQTVATAAAQHPAAVEASLRLDPPARRLIQRGLQNEGFDPGTPDGLFGPRTRAAIRRWQEARGTPSMGYLHSAAAQLVREAGGAPRSSSPPPVSRTDANEPSVAAAQVPSSSADVSIVPGVRRDPPTSPAANRQPAAQAAVTAQLPPEILVDRHLVRVDRLLADDDYGAALAVMDEIVALQRQHDLVLPEEFYFKYAEVAFGTGLTETAIASLNEYLVAAGRDGDFYRDALELLDAAEDTLRRAEAERQRVERERQRADARQRAHDALVQRQLAAAARPFPRDALRSNVSSCRRRACSDLDGCGLFFVGGPRACQ